MAPSSTMTPRAFERLWYSLMASSVADCTMGAGTEGQPQRPVTRT